MLLDAIVEYLPSPLDVPALQANDLKIQKRLMLKRMMMRHWLLWLLRSRQIHLSEDCVLYVFILGF